MEIHNLNIMFENCRNPLGMMDNSETHSFVPDQQIIPQICGRFETDGIQKLISVSLVVEYYVCKVSGEP